MKADNSTAMAVNLIEFMEMPAFKYFYLGLLQHQIDVLQDSINSIDPKKNETLYSAHDVNRMVRNILIKLRDEPDSQIKEQLTSEYLTAGYQSE